MESGNISAAQEVPQISLEHIIAVNKVADRALQLEEKAELRYEADLTEAVKPHIERKRCLFSWKHFWQEYDFVGKKFFRVGGTYKSVERAAFSKLMRDYHPFLNDVLKRATEARKAKKLFGKAHETVREIRNIIAEYPSKDEPDGQTLLFPDPIPADKEEKMDEYIDSLYSLVKEYDSAAAGLAPNLPSVETHSNNNELQSNVENFNRILLSLRGDVYTANRAEIIGRLFDLSHSISMALESIASSFEKADLASLRWKSEDFSHYLSWQLGFEVKDDPTLYNNRHYRPGFAIKWIEKPNPQS